MRFARYSLLLPLLDDELEVAGLPLFLPLPISPCLGIEPAISRTSFNEIAFSGSLSSNQQCHSRDRLILVGLQDAFEVALVVGPGHEAELVLLFIAEQ
jgi:hypothetical protein